VAIAAIGMLQKLLAEIGTPLKIIMKIWCWFEPMSLCDKNA
jgi:hypothetical protein